MSNTERSKNLTLIFKLTKVPSEKYFDKLADKTDSYLVKTLKVIKALK